MIGGRSRVAVIFIAGSQQQQSNQDHTQYRPASK